MKMRADIKYIVNAKTIIQSGVFVKLFQAESTIEITLHMDQLYCMDFYVSGIIHSKFCHHR